MPGPRTPSSSGDRRRRRARHLTAAFLASAGLSGSTCAPPPEGEKLRENVPAVQSAAAPEPAAAPGRTAGAPRARSRLPALKAIELTLEAGTAEGDLALDVRFENVTDSGFGLSTRRLSGGDFELRDTDGTRYPPVSWSPELESIIPPEGFAPGHRVSGTVTFRRPWGAEPLELRFPDFEPIVFRGQDLSEARPAPAERPALPPGRTGGQDPLEKRLAEELARQARAMESSDLAAYLETFHRDRHEVEREAFVRMRRLNPTEVSLEPVSVLDLKNGADFPIHAKVSLRYRLHGLPEDNPFVQTLGYVFDSEYRAGKITDDPSRPVVWRRDFALHRTNHFLVVSDLEIEKDIFDISNEIEGAYAELYRQGLPMSSGYLVQIMADARAYARVAQAPESLGVALARYFVLGSRFVVDSRAFYVNGSHYLRDTRRAFVAYRETIVNHELVHLALAGVTHPSTPPWLREGTAVYFSNDISYDANRDLVHGGLARLDLAAMTRSDSLLHAGRDQAVEEYLYAGNVVAFLIEAKGRDHLLDFYRAYADPELHRQAGASPEGLTEAGLRRFYGLGVAELDRRVKEWMRIRHP